MSRRLIVLLTVTVLLVLDAGRSYYGRVGYARPTETWQPTPALYADLAWPPGADIRPEASLGEQVFARRCAVCHGPDGRGNGPAAPSMIPRPRDFTLSLFKYKSTPRFDPPTDDDLRRVVGNGLAASAMPGFADLLSDGEIREALAEPIRMIIQAVRDGLERTPPELAADICDRGIVLTGGGALLQKMDERLRVETGLPVQVAEDPLSSVVLGAGKMLSDFNLLRKISIE